MRTWLFRTDQTDDPAGDLIDDMRQDRDLPTTFASLEAMQDYLRSRRACPEAIAASEGLWRRYCREIGAINRRGL